MTDVDYDPTVAHSIRVKIEPVGDYSSYTLALDPTVDAFDPLFVSIDFRFRPGCFNSNCAPLSDAGGTDEQPLIDYMAKDFDSFKHVMINAMRERVPDWQPTSEADQDMVLIDLIAARADELSDYQDRVMNEAYFGRARKRLSLARYARLLDYHIHQGNQATTQLALKVDVDTDIDRGFGVWSGGDWQDTTARIFTVDRQTRCYAILNELYLYSWGNVVTALEAGSTQADLITTSGSMSKIEADGLVTLIIDNRIRRLLVQQQLNPETGTTNGVDKSARQIVTLDSELPAESIEDPVNGTWLLRVYWNLSDQLKRRYCFISECDGVVISAISSFHANLLDISYGRPQLTIFKTLGSELSPPDKDSFVQSDEQCFSSSNWGTVCELADPYLVYRDTLPSGDVPTRSSLRVQVSGIAGDWEEQSDLLQSQPDDFHFIVETDERQFSRLRFGNNINGRALDDTAEVSCYYQRGLGSDGNVGVDSMLSFDNSASGNPNVTEVWNPLDVSNGRDPEKADQILRRVPEAYRSRQLRAITLRDYIERAEQLDSVSHAHARYVWSGSWRSVRISIDPKGSDTFNDELREQITRHLDAVRLIGEDLEVRGARYVPLDISLRLCIHADFWPEDVEYELQQALSYGYSASGAIGLFHPDNWTFGQTLYASQIIGYALQISGVDRVLQLSIRRWHATTGTFTDSIVLSPDELELTERKRLEVQAHEIIQLANDPTQLEKGRIQFDIAGGRGA